MAVLAHITARNDISSLTNTSLESTSRQPICPTITAECSEPSDLNAPPRAKGLVTGKRAAGIGKCGHATTQRPKPRSQWQHLARIPFHFHSNAEARSNAVSEPPWLAHMSSSSPSSPAAGGPSHASSSSSHDANPPTFAAFSPTPLGHHSTTSLASSSTSSNRRSTVTLVHQKSPLLVATPAQITRALAQFHPFLGPLNALAGLLTWTTGDPWESFLLLAVFWAVALYGDVVLRWAGPLVAVVGLIAVLYLRRFSALSSTRWTGEKGNEQGKEKVGGGGSQRKTLDDIVETLKLFTSRCNILLDPLLQFTEYLSTQKTATSATTRPALTSLFIRILIITPVWIILTLPPLYIITTRRFVLTVGTLILSWHSRPARVSRTILWRSRTLRRLSSAITGLHFDASEPSATTPPKLPPRKDKGANEIAASLAAKRGLDSAGIRFTFTLYENQRRWLGLGWTPSMLTYERAPWTDEHLNPMPSKEEFELPDVDGGHARWRWVEGSEWQVDTGASEGGKARSETKRSRDAGGGAEWVYYDNKVRWFSSPLS